MTKQAYQLMTLESFEDMLYYEDIKIDSMTMEDGQVRLELSGDGLPVDDGSIGEQVKTQISPDTTKPYYRMESKLAKRRDSF